MKRVEPFANSIAASTNFSEHFPSSPTGILGQQTIPGQLRTETQSCQDIHTIVVPLDGSPHAEHALPHALAIARRTGASLRIVHVYSDPFAIEPWQGSSAFDVDRVDRRKYLDRIAGQIARVHHLRPEIVLIDSLDTIDALIKSVASSDLVVIGSRRHRLASRLWWQNKVDQLRRRLSIPLLVIKGNSTPVDLTTTPVVNQILLPLDGSAPDQTVLDCAKFAAHTHGGTITLLNVQNEEWTAGLFPHSGPKEYLAWIFDRLRQEGIDAVAYVFTSSQDPRIAINSYAESHNVDLIAIPTNGDGGLTRFMRLSVADYLLRHSKRPVFLQSIPGRPKRPELTKIN